MRKKGPYVIRRKPLDDGRWNYKLIDTRDNRVIIQTGHAKPQSPTYMRTLQAKYNTSAVLNELGVS